MDLILGNMLRIILILALFSVTGDCIYLRYQEIQKVLRISDIKNNTEVISLKPLSYLEEELEPRNRADYYIIVEAIKYKYLKVDSEGRVLFSKQPPVKTSLKATAKVAFQGKESTTVIKLDIDDTPLTPQLCPPPTKDDCFSGNFTFRVVNQGIDGRPVLLGIVGSPSECYRAQYNHTIASPKNSKRILASKFRIDSSNGSLFFNGDLEGYSEVSVRVKCLIWSSDPKNNVTKKAFTRDFPVNVIHAPELPYPVGSQTRTIVVNSNFFTKGSSLLLFWYWLPENTRYTNRTYDLPENTQIWTESVFYNTFNLKSNLLLIYLNWTNDGWLKNNNTFSIKLSRVSQSPFIPEPQNNEIILSIVIIVNVSIPAVNYTTDTLPASEYLSPFASLATPLELRELSNTTITFRLGMPDFVQTPYNITKKGGIIYLEHWGPQAFPCLGPCPSLLIIEWTKSESETRTILGTKVFKISAERKANGQRRCKEQGKSISHWNLCSALEDQKACNKSCGLAALNSHCSWRDAKLPVRSTTSPNEIVPTPTILDLTTEFATCRSDSRTCPDAWCDPLENLHPSICPQDCTNFVSGGNMNKGTKRGIFSAGFRTVCTCTRASMCYCGVRLIKHKTGTETDSDEDDENLNKINDQDEDDENHSKDEVPGPATTHQLQNTKSPGIYAEYCDETCKTVITVCSCIIVLVIASLTFFRRRLCFGLGKFKDDITEDGTMSIDPLVPLQTLSTSPTTVTESNLDHGSEIDTKWEVPRSRIEILETLGEGEFGKVLKARAKDLPSKQGLTIVAVKTLKENAGTLELNDLTSEYQLLKEVNHPNVIKLLGACTSSDGPIYIIIEYCSLGSLRSYLRKSRNAKAHECLEAGSIEVSPKDILSFSWQICKGMAYLAEMKMVHRDLATRNILLAENKKCKISDFGMTRDVYVDDTYLKVSRSRVPVKWMALESLREHVYTSKSDVWSMGIVLWELVTLGSSPYPGIPAEKLYGLLTSGYRMPRPTNCSKRLYEIMRDCWAKEPYRRPTFIQLTHKFESMLGEDIEYLNCNINAFSNPAYFNSKPNTAMNNLDIRFSMSLDDLKSAQLNEGFNLYENEQNQNTSNVNYDVPKPISKNIYVHNMKIKDKRIDEKVDNR